MLLKVNCFTADKGKCLICRVSVGAEIILFCMYVEEDCISIICISTLEMSNMTIMFAISTLNNELKKKKILHNLIKNIFKWLFTQLFNTILFL